MKEPLPKEISDYWKSPHRFPLDRKKTLAVHPEDVDEQWYAFLSALHRAAKIEWLTEDENE